MPNSVFRWDNDTPRAWDAALSRVCPAGDNLSQFRIFWESGEPSNPIQRWVIWQLRPISKTQELIYKRTDPRILGLTQPHPRRHTWWDAKAGMYRKWGGGTAMTDRLTWEIYQRTGRFAQRWWVIQGRTGGHRYHLNSVEKKLLSARTEGRMVDSPPAGDLCYAEFDQRVVEHVGQLEQVALWQRVLVEADGWRRLDAEEQAAAEVARVAMADWLDKQFGATWDQYGHVIKDSVRHLPRPISTRENRPVPADNDAWREQYVKLGT